MSTEEQEPTNQEYSSDYQAKLMVHERDRNQCLNCREVFEDTSHLDVDHNVARGKGGSNAVSNKATLCRRCHEAKHDQREHAPTVRFQSTGNMPENDFRWFRHLSSEQFPAFTEIVVSDQVVPKFNLAEHSAYEAWHIPLGDLRRLDKALTERDDITYASMKAHHYMR